MLLYRNDTGRYFRLGRSSRMFVPHLQKGTTPRFLVQQVSDSFQVRESAAARTVTRFLAEIREMGLLDVPPPARGLRGRFARALAEIPMGRLVLVRDSSPPAAVGRQATWGSLARVVAGAFVGVIALLAVGVAVLGATWRLDIGALGGASVAIPLILLLHLTLHEAGHWLACRFYGVTVPEAGIAFWFWVLPRPYVDRSHAYRLARRTPLVVITVSGIVIDAVNAGIAGAVALAADDPTLRALAAAMAYILVMTLANDVNPLLPSDGLHAIEAATGQLAFRRRAIQYLLTLLLRLPSSHHQEFAGRRLRLMYLGYGVLSLGYLAAVVLLFARLVASVGG
ncbi:PqqD family protein [Spongiactinospora rosea]|uniref:PqqD family protein n=1 Tax=Spongiactinospora rosea TaxID=2248750 RepID=UPI0011C0736B|nr:PqqD family protein [Spongiactinospora rosea]